MDKVAAQNKIEYYEKQIKILNIDVNEYYLGCESDIYDVITCNPPYFKYNIICTYLKLYIFNILVEKTRNTILFFLQLKFLVLIFPKILIFDLIDIR